MVTKKNIPKKLKIKKPASKKISLKKTQPVSKKRSKMIVKKTINQPEEFILEVKKMTNDVVTPEYIMDSDIGLDIRANETVNIKPLEQKIVKTGLKIRIPEGHVGLIRDRAGIVSNMNVHTAAGTFDTAYRGEISIILVNMGEEEVQIEKGMRIAQMIVIPVRRVKIEIVDSLSVTNRGENGFGSTGIKDKIKAFQEIEKEISKMK
jgi:dUTP pyrophosphatase